MKLGTPVESETVAARAATIVEIGHVKNLMVGRALGRQKTLVPELFQKLCLT
jgi:hypothetical protein